MKQDTLAPWEVVGSEDTTLSSRRRPTAPTWWDSPFTAGGHITGVDESLFVGAITPDLRTSPDSIVTNPGVPAGGDHQPWSATVDIPSLLTVGSGESAPYTVVVYTGGHVQQHERLTIQGVIVQPRSLSHLVLSSRCNETLGRSPSRHMYTTFLYPPEALAVIRPSHRLRASMFRGARWPPCCSQAALATPAPDRQCTSGRDSHPAAPTSPVSATTTASETFSSPTTQAGALTAATSSDVRRVAAGRPRSPCRVRRRSAAWRQRDPRPVLRAGEHRRSEDRLRVLHDPWTSGVRLILTAALPTPDATTRTTPWWALQLSPMAARCVAVTGTVDQVGSVDLRYSCGDTAEAGLVMSGTARVRPLQVAVPRPEATPSR